MVSYRCIGYGITGNDGVATLDTNLDETPIGEHSYTGSGVGELDFVASVDSPTQINSGSDVSLPYEVEDCIRYDACTTDTHTSYTAQGSTLAFSTDKLVFTRTADGECYAQYLGTVADYKGKTIRFKCDIVNSDKNAELKIYQQVNGSFNSSTSATSTTDGTLYVDKQIDANATMILFRIMCNGLDSGESCGFRNFKAYPI